jgi:triacylglycerol lipase
VLAHGIARFDYPVELYARTLERFFPGARPLFDSIHYFKGIGGYLERNGFAVFRPNVAFAAGVQFRATQLKKAILGILSESGHEKVNVIAHSMGGLDARHMIVDFEMAGAVAGLTTIGTPHLGSSAADRRLRQGGEMLISRLAGILDLTGFRDLTILSCRAFNDRAEAAEAENPVVYRTCASTAEFESVFFTLRRSWRIVREAEGPNDGLVSEVSQKWKSALAAPGGKLKNVEQISFPIEADHLNQLGWGFGSENARRIVSDFYLSIARKMSAVE